MEIGLEAHCLLLPSICIFVLPFAQEQTVASLSLSVCLSLSLSIEIEQNFYSFAFLGAFLVGFELCIGYIDWLQRSSCRDHREVKLTEETICFEDDSEGSFFVLCADHFVERNKTVC
ncbi:hypothetical protein CRG98_024321 [Punica granatum]|uniref:Uncharacterized protein n=1 Tax=Punica granatum TaxID=22663 RepID=A0A2I0JGA7_PUNGR|nr:hypothetical protein CRG98_024321 [Punica granatum]